MSRIIKFRFYSKILNKFVIPNNDIFVGTFKDPDMAVMQFTGLTDRDSKEIYEGDILAYDEHYSGDYKHTPWKLPVVFSEGAFDLESDGERWAESLAYLTLNNLCEVIGNIYENKDLLQ
jgi:uncharacterized phage protein (TIGR01671 family)